MAQRKCHYLIHSHDGANIMNSVDKNAVSKK